MYLHHQRIIYLDKKYELWIIENKRSEYRDSLNRDGY